MVRDESLRLQRLVDDLLLLARADEGGHQPRSPVAVDLDDVVGAVVGSAGSQPAITVDLTGLSGGQVRGDPVALDRLVANLVDNAVRHAAGGSSSASPRSTTGAVTLTVEDDGPGIPAHERERVFERFVRLDEARSRDAGGSGLGLAIVAAVARTHRATVTIDDRPGGGTRVRVVFPGR